MEASENMANYQSPKRTVIFGFEFGLVRLEFQKIGSGSVRSDLSFKKSVRVRFGSNSLSKSWFGFGSTLVPNVGSGSVRQVFRF